jgi:uncharacterized protein with NAD-binding domain and iron-sulfur cluster
MSHLIDYEEWPPGPGQDVAPGQISYFCGALEEPFRRPDPVADPDYPQQQLDRVRENVATFLENDVYRLWPEATMPTSNRFNWNLLLDPSGATGSDRLNSQFVKANVEPSDRYVLSLPGTTRYRLQSDQSGFGNLFLAGDWTYTGINGGCMEAAVMSGLRAARGIAGYSQEIIGED